MDTERGGSVRRERWIEKGNARCEWSVERRTMSCSGTSDSSLSSKSELDDAELRRAKIKLSL